MSSPKENILKRLQQAQNNRGRQTVARPDFDAPIYLPQDEDLAANFKTNLELVGGHVIQVKDQQEIQSTLKELIQQEQLDNLVCLEPKLQELLGDDFSTADSLKELDKIGTGITSCEFLVAHLGSVMVSSASSSGRRAHVFPETHIVIAHSKQIVNFLDEALEQLENKYQEALPSMITNITGPSRTADIEKTLVMGMHGPKKLFVLLANEPF
ncbi:lactate utilization protein C [Sunxiuqinia elliptica]|uniref:L-lactate dehydrogenase complex protein LldG n=1 Tax=Sunxiuqinia elliptica TaxID=655355 RepID=A0A4R6GM57_9BACT|nr:LUD domain-containing protein [Sunxiuqinia elliptica]TDN96271.1 L-lactate dehydrogenase complex protein LldG [Sunxiuqinia elliptica]TDO67982.1 L-lactate dehydrogenase complex protein LldG [Sunxiuqinia elliptica]